MVVKFDADLAHLLRDAGRQWIEADKGDFAQRTALLRERPLQALEGQARIGVLEAESLLAAGEDHSRSADQGNLGKLRRSRQAFGIDHENGGAGVPREGFSGLAIG